MNLINLLGVVPIPLVISLVPHGLGLIIFYDAVVIPKKRKFFM